MLELVDSRKL